MRNREDVSTFIDSQMLDSSDDLYRSKECRIRYGKQELKELMDFIYEGKPKSVKEELKCEGEGSFVKAS